MEPWGPYDESNHGRTLSRKPFPSWAFSLGALAIGACLLLLSAAAPANGPVLPPSSLSAHAESVQAAEQSTTPIAGPDRSSSEPAAEGPATPGAPTSSYVTSLHVGTNPGWATYDTGNGYLYVLNSGSENVTVVDGTKVIRSIVVGTNPVSSVYDRADGDVYVVNYGSDNVTVINGTNVVDSVYVGNEPMSLAYDSSNECVYVVDSGGSSSVSIINGSTVVRTLRVGVSPDDAIYDSGDHFVYIVNQGSSNVTILNGTKLVASVPVGTTPWSSTYDDQNQYVYVANLGSDSVSVIYRTSVIQTISVGIAPRALTYDEANGYVYVTNFGSGNLSVLNATTVVRSIVLGAGADPIYVTYDQGDHYVYVANEGSNNVSVIDGTNMTQSIEVGTSPFQITYDSRDGYLYVMNYYSNNVSVVFTGYEVTFWATGLPAGIQWSVILNGTTRKSTSSIVVFGEPDGNYSYAVAAAEMYTPIPASGKVIVDGGNHSVAVNFSPPNYAVAFTESGLPAGTNWSVTIGLIPRSSNVATILFQEPNGTYLYTVGAVPGWRTPNYTGSITVRGGAFTTVDWLRSTYGVTFMENGLPPSTVWWVNVTSGRATDSEGPTLSFSEPNGSYYYSVASLDKAYACAGGSFTVAGINVSAAVAFAEVTYTVSVTETGLPSETGWWVNVTGGPLTLSATDTLAFQETNGSHTYSASATNANYSSSGGSFVVTGHAVSVTVGFSQTAFPVVFTTTGLSAGTNWSVTFRGTTRSGTENLEFTTVPNGSYAFAVGSVPGYGANPTSGTVRVQGGLATESITFAATGPPHKSRTNSNTFLGLPATEGYAVLGVSILAILGVTAAGVLMRGRGGNTLPGPLTSPSRFGRVPPPPIADREPRALT